MRTLKQISLLAFFFLFNLSLSCQTSIKNQHSNNDKKNIIVGANQSENYLDLLKNKKIAIVANNTSVIFKDDKIGSNYEHLVDSLLTLKINITKVFAPEHGFRGVEDAGTIIKDGIDSKTKLPVISLYGKNRKPSQAHMENIDMVVFDIQDVGVRFYTYISTLEYVMEACAENNIPMIILDRPNPNGHYIDGPVVKEGFKSFVGMQQVPIIYGMTIGEYAQMLNGEKWLKDGIQCNLTIIPLKNYTHNSFYSLPLRPSPNLPNDKSINLYASICMFEGTNVSCGRGTEMQFQIFGSPDLPKNIYNFSFTPQPNFGSSNPKYLNELCYGLDLSKIEMLNSLNFKWLIEAYHSTSEKDKFFEESFFNKLAGTDNLKIQIEQGLSFEEIKATWQEDLNTFKKIRDKYLIYSTN